MAQADVFVSGGGIAGLTLAIGLARVGRTVILVDPAPPPATEQVAAADLRSTAYLGPARDLLAEIGAWGALSPYATPLSALRVINCHGTPPQIGKERLFEARDIGEESFGWNIPNWRARHVLTEVAQNTDGLTLHTGLGFQAILTRDRAARVTLTDGRRLDVRLVLAADGRNSPLRSALGIETRVTRYGQKALAFAVTHPKPHNSVSIELYDKGGAFVLVPMQDQEDGTPASSVVWMQDGPEALRLHGLGAAEFAQAATARSAEVLGPLTPITARNIWPVITQTATALTAQRTALLAEAAHVMPPIGAQGLNTSFGDIRALLSRACDGEDEIGAPAWLNSYAASRRRDIDTRMRVIDLYNRLCRSAAPPARALRDAGLTVLHDVAPLRHALMRAGLGG